MKSVALIGNSAFSLVTFRGELIRALVARELTVFALAPDFDTDSRAVIEALGAEPVSFSLSRVGLSPLRDGVDVIKLRALLRRLRPDAVLCYFIKPVVYGTIAAFLAGVPRRLVLIEGLGYYFTPGGKDGLTRRLVRFSLRILLRLAFSMAHRILFLNRDDAALLAPLLEERKIRVIGAIGVDLDRFAEVPLPEAPPAFVMVARILREKGVCEYVDAAREVAGASFAFIGGTDHNPGGIAAAQIEAWQAEHVVRWAGQVDDVRPELARSSVFVLPSYREGVPRSTQEAMAMGRAVITTDAPGCRDTVVDGLNGILVPPGDAKALAAAMRRFVDDPGLASRMGRESRRLAEERFDVRRANGILLDELVGTPA
jgi:glycosyltransferase involved in cell wall biosynthesis